MSNNNYIKLWYIIQFRLFFTFFYFNETPTIVPPERNYELYVDNINYNDALKRLHERNIIFIIICYIFFTLAYNTTDNLHILVTQ